MGRQLAISNRLTGGIGINQRKDYVLRFNHDLDLKKILLGCPTQELNLSIKAGAEIIWMKSSNKKEIHLLIDDVENIKYDEDTQEVDHIKRTLTSANVEVTDILSVNSHIKPVIKKSKILKLPTNNFILYLLENPDKFTTHEIGEAERDDFSKAMIEIFSSSRKPKRIK